MAATTNLMSVNVPANGTRSAARTTSSTLQRQQLSQKYKSGISNTKNFDRVFDKVNDSAAASPKNTTASDAPKEKKDTVAVAVTTSAQGKSVKDTQDAPQKKSQSTQESQEIEKIDELDEPEESGRSSQASQSIYMMDLLAFTESGTGITSDNLAGSVENEGTNLMTILPQESDTKGQAMLNLLSGRTWQVNEPSSSNAVELSSADVVPSESAEELNILQMTGNTPKQILSNGLTEELQPVSDLVPETQNLNQSAMTANLSVKDLQPTNLSQTNEQINPLISENAEEGSNNLLSQIVQTDSLTPNNAVETQSSSNQPNLLANDLTQSGFSAQLSNAQSQSTQPNAQMNANEQNQPVIQMSDETGELKVQNLISADNSSADTSEQSGQNANSQPIEQIVQGSQASETTANETPKVQIDKQPVNAEIEEPVQLQDTGKNVQNNAQNQPAQPLSYSAVRQTPQQSEQTAQVVIDQQPVIEEQVNDQPVHTHLDQKNLTANQEKLVEQPQVQSTVAEQNVNRQQMNQSNFNFADVEAELNENPEIVKPNQSTQQQSQQNPQQNLQSNAQSSTTTDIQSEEPAQPQTLAEAFANNLGTAVNNLNNQQTPQVEQNQQAATLRQDFDITGQIVEHAKMIRTAENTEMVIHLKPEHLGELTLRVSVTSNGSVNASFHSDNAMVRAMIENTLVHLKQELANQGLKVDSVQVYSGLDGNLMNGRGQQAWQQNQQGGNARHGRRIDFAKLDEKVAELNATPTPVENVASADGVDYRV